MTSPRPSPWRGGGRATRFKKVFSVNTYNNEKVNMKTPTSSTNVSLPLKGRAGERSLHFEFFKK
jgi:hypothetical protein